MRDSARFARKNRRALRWWADGSLRGCFMAWVQFHRISLGERIAARHYAEKALAAAFRAMVEAIIYRRKHHAALRCWTGSMLERFFGGWRMGVAALKRQAMKHGNAMSHWGAQKCRAALKTLLKNAQRGSKRRKVTPPLHASALPTQAVALLPRPAGTTHTCAAPVPPPRPFCCGRAGCACAC